MHVLDCTDPETAAHGVAALFATTPATLYDALRAAWDSVAAEEHDPTGVPLRAVSAQLTTPAMPDLVHYFHGTRTADPDTFWRSGLRPLSDAIDSIWAFIGSLLHEIDAADLAHLRDVLLAGAGPHTYGHRHDSLDYGPCGHLIRDALLHPEEYDSVDYLSGSEIAVDICHGVAERFGIDALSRYRAATSACIVRFSARPARGPSTVNSALWFLMTAKRGERTRHALEGHDGGGRAVPVASVLSVEIDPL